MALIEATLRAYLAAHAGLAALVGGRIYPIRLPQGTGLPAVCYRRVSGVRKHNVNGLTLVARPRFQFDCWAYSYAEAKAVAEEVRQALNGYHGAGWDSVIDNDLDTYEPESGLYRTIVDALIWHTEV